MPAETQKPRYGLAIWGVAGFLALLGKALYQLTPLALAPIREGMLSGVQIALYGGWVLFMGYSEGYKAFHLQVAPRVAVRGMWLARNPRPHLAILAPLFVMGLIHATRRRLITSWTILVGVVLLVIGVRFLDQPWRGIVDGGVVVGLGWGFLAQLWFFIAALAGKPPDVSAELPDGESVSASA